MKKTDLHPLVALLSTISNLEKELDNMPPCNDDNCPKCGKSKSKPLIMLNIPEGELAIISEHEGRLEITHPNGETEYLPFDVKILGKIVELKEEWDEYLTELKAQAETEKLVLKAIKQIFNG